MEIMLGIENFNMSLVTEVLPSGLAVVEAGIKASPYFRMNVD